MALRGGGSVCRVVPGASGQPGVGGGEEVGRGGWCQGKRRRTGQEIGAEPASCLKAGEEGECRAPTWSFGKPVGAGVDREEGEGRAEVQSGGDGCGGGKRWMEEGAGSLVQEGREGPGGKREEVRFNMFSSDRCP